MSFVQIVQEVWGLVLLAAIPIAGVVGFFVNVHLVRKLELEKQKLSLEIEMLRRQLAKDGNRIEVATLDQVETYARASRRSEHPVGPLLAPIALLGLAFVVLSKCVG